MDKCPLESYIEYFVITVFQVAGDGLRKAVVSNADTNILDKAMA